MSVIFRLFVAAFFLGALSTLGGIAPSGASTTWTAASVPSPANEYFDFSSGSNDSAAANVDCPVADWCAAFGKVNTASGSTSNVIEILSGGSWTPTLLPNPPAEDEANAAPDLSAMSCPAMGQCVVWGEYVNSSLQVVPMVETLANGSWTETDLSLPSGYSYGIDSTYPTSILISAQLWCSTDACIAVMSPDQGPLVWTETGGTWSVAPLPLPANAATSKGSKVSSLSCVGDGACVAVGDYVTSTTGPTVRQLVIETLSGSNWTAAQAPLPANALGASDYPNYGDQPSVSCADATDCVAVANYEPTVNGTTSSDDGEGLIEQLSGSTWTASEAPLPSNAGANVPYVGSGLDDTIVVMSSVSCPAPGSCVAIGGYEDDEAYWHGLIESLSDGMWTDTEAPIPPAENPGLPAWLQAISCPAVGSCIAVGGSGLGGKQGDTSFVDSENGPLWNSTSTTAEYLNAVSCPAVDACTAIGNGIAISSVVSETQGSSTCGPAFTSTATATATTRTPMSIPVTTCDVSDLAPYPTMITGAQLPKGLHVVNSGNGTATITGTPSPRDSGVYSGTLTASIHKSVVAEQTVSITVDSAPTIKGVAKLTATVGAPFTAQLPAASGYPIPALSTPSLLPTGVTLDDNGNGTATLSGTPSSDSAGTYVIDFTANNGVGSPANRAVTLTVN